MIVIFIPWASSRKKTRGVVNYIRIGYRLNVFFFTQMMLGTTHLHKIFKIKIKENEFSIENKGKQIDEKRMDTIWESFVSDDQKGTGLGLAIVRNILELHEMSYGVHNLEDGVEFYFRWKK